LEIEICFKPVIVRGEVKKKGGEESCEKKEKFHPPCLVTPIKYSVWGTALKSLEI